MAEPDCKLTIKFREGKKRSSKTVNLSQEQATQFLEFLVKRFEEGRSPKQVETGTEM